MPLRVGASVFAWVFLVARDLCTWVFLYGLLVRPN